MVRICTYDNLFGIGALRALPIAAMLVASGAAIASPASDVQRDADPLAWQKACFSGPASGPAYAAPTPAPASGPPGGGGGGGGVGPAANVVESAPWAYTYAEIDRMPAGDVQIVPAQKVCFFGSTSGPRGSAANVVESAPQEFNGRTILLPKPAANVVVESEPWLYTAAEIGRMREAVRAIIVQAKASHCRAIPDERTAAPPGTTAVCVFYIGGLAEEVEAELRTYIFAGITPEALEAEAKKEK